MRDDEKARHIALIAEQMRAHDISLAEVAQAMGIANLREKRSTGDILSRLFSTLGGILIFAGLSAYIAVFWDGMGSLMRILVTLGFGLALQYAAIVQMGKDKRGRVAKSLMVVSILLQTGGWFVLLNELLPRGPDERYAVLFVTGVMGLQQAAMFLKYRLTLLLFAVLCFGYSFAFVTLDVLDADERLSIFVMGLSMMALAQAVRASAHFMLSPPGFFIGSAMALAVLFDWLQGTAIEPVYLGAVAGMLYISTLLRSGALLAVSTLAMLCYIGYFTGKHFMDSGAWPIVLMLLGALFYGIGMYALRLSRSFNT